MPGRTCAAVRSARFASGGRSAPHGRDCGRERVVNVLSFNGRPGTRQGSRTPHLRCGMARRVGGRGVSLDIWLASHSAPAAPRAVRLSGHDRDRSPSRTTRRATPGLARQARSLRASAASLAVNCTLPPARYHEVGVPVPLRCVDRLCYCVAARHWRSFSLPVSHAGLFVPATSPVATGVCGAP